MGRLSVKQLQKYALVLLFLHDTENRCAYANFDCISVPQAAVLTQAKTYEKETITPIAINTGTIVPENYGRYTNIGSWEFYGYGVVNGIFDHQTGLAKDHKVFSTNSFLAVLERQFCASSFSLRTIFSLEPATIGPCGYPLLFSTAGSADGVTVLVNRFPAHELFSELSASCCAYWGSDTCAYGYFGLPGSPALGPLFTQRIAAFYLPEGPISWQEINSTDICFGVGTLGIKVHNFGLEGSIFNGRQPDEDHWRFETPRFDSFCTRIYCYPICNIITQISWGFLKSPEELEPEVRVTRLTASASYNHNWENNFFQITGAWARNDHRPGDITNSFLLESCINLCDRHIFSTRFERIAPTDPGVFIDYRNWDDPDKQSWVTISKIGAGYLYQLPCLNCFRFSAGASANIALSPRDFVSTYGRHPFSYFLFLRFELL